MRRGDGFGCVAQPAAPCRRDHHVLPGHTGPAPSLGAFPPRSIAPRTAPHMGSTGRERSMTQCGGSSTSAYTEGPAELRHVRCRHCVFAAAPQWRGVSAGRRVGQRVVLWGVASCGGSGVGGCVGRLVVLAVASFRHPRFGRREDSYSAIFAASAAASFDLSILSRSSTSSCHSVATSFVPASNENVMRVSRLQVTAPAASAATNCSEG